MRITKAKSGITLVELLIVMSIIAVLSVIIFRTFLSISEISFRVEQQRNVSNELVSISQIVQNYADNNTIDYEAYKAESLKSQEGGKFKTLEKSDKLLLDLNKGITNILYLSGNDGKIKLYSSGDCIDMTMQATGLADKQCFLELDRNGEIVQLSNPKKIYISNIMFKIIPWAAESDYTTGYMGDNIINKLNKPGFWLLAQAYNAKYNSTIWANKIHINLQQFFNIK